MAGESTVGLCGEAGCFDGARNPDGLCDLHHVIRVARVRCEARRCKPSCTRGKCWRKPSAPVTDEDIRALRREAIEARDGALADLCALALRAGPAAETTARSSVEAIVHGRRMLARADQEAS